ncbi:MULTISPECIES: heme exporter protein CcmB [Rhizobium]|uniref:Heme exporter protein B n=1 Tax=Rhizobium tropici TaxID=398 RepID=A0A6P1C292_RHITR|nr:MULTISPECIES: heme exporter protein CcmB [Rhizobium]AGB72783.1 heme ABC exporter, permease protein CcmB [Rhizobium tropici CIAT 899]MBB4241078.1 heme exporter protein B [Rhizobium tropici]MBB5592375.1 heme exporter protein B [Rhizobium tropici]MBB6491403.1 heme exporter protein B [Rhizobium tropici]NEV10546.1 heme exporter protein CcmB [Rhizobium tropici]
MTALLLRDLRLSVRAGGGALIGILFFLTVVAIIPFAVGPDLKLLSRIGPAIVWIGALLASLLGLDRLFQAERDDGSLDLLVMQETPLVLTVFIKCAAHWVATGLPLVIASPLLGLFMNMNETAIAATALTLLVGSPALTFIGAVGAAVAVALPRGGLLVSILVLPLTIPVLIFGVSATYAAVEGPQPFLPPFLILIALTLFFAVLGPAAAALALRNTTD